jgi:hypothetical protein
MSQELLKADSECEQSTISRIQSDRSPGSELDFDLRPMDLALRYFGAGTKAAYQGIGCKLPCSHAFGSVVCESDQILYR